MAKREVVVKDCDRCAGKKKPATVTRRWTLDGDQYELDLCDAHGSQFDRDMSAWARVSRDITPEVYEVSSPFSKQVARDRASKLKISDSALLKMRPPEDGTIVVQKLPANIHAWTLTPHAITRCGDRKVAEIDALIAACDPAIARQDPNTGYWIHTRGHVHAVVNRNTKHVITVVTDATLSKKEREAVNG